MENSNILQIGGQTIDLDALKNMDKATLIQVFEAIYFSGYEAGMKSNAEQAMEDGFYKYQYERKVKERREESVEKGTETKNEVVKDTIIEEERIEISSILKSGSKNPLEDRMQEISEMVYRFKKPGYVIYRQNGLDEEYLRTKYGFTHLPMKALVFDTMEEAKSYKESYWGAGANELKIKQV